MKVKIVEGCIWTFVYIETLRYTEKRTYFSSGELLETKRVQKFLIIKEGVITKL